MPYEEMLKWASFLESNPIGWREDMRFYKIMKCIGIKAKPEEVFESLKIKKTADKNEKGFSITNFKQSALFSFITKAGGELPPILE